MTNLHLGKSLAIAALCALTFATTSNAEPKFPGDQLILPTYGPVDRFVQECDFNQRRIDIAGQFGRSHDGTGQPWRLGNRLARLSLSASPKTRRGVAIGRWRQQRIPRGEIVFGTKFDSSGRLYYVTGKPLLRGKNRTLHVLRTTPAGKVDQSFGTGGRITLTRVGRAVQNNPYLRARIVPAGSRPLVVLSSPGRTEVHRINRRRVDRSWSPYRINLAVADTVTAATDGSVFVGATAVVNGQAQPGVGLTKLLPTGLVDRTFGTDGVWDAPRIEDAAYPSSNPASTGPSVLGITSGVVANASGSLTVAVKNTHSVATFTFSTFRFVEVDATGSTNSISAAKGTYSFGGDIGFPRASPFHFGPSQLGTSIAIANGWFFGDGARAEGFFASSQTPEQRLDLVDFAATAFAGSPSSTNLLACGAIANRRQGDGRERTLALKTLRVG